MYTVKGKLYCPSVAIVWLIPNLKYGTCSAVFTVFSLGAQDWFDSLKTTKRGL